MKTSAVLFAVALFTGLFGAFSSKAASLPSPTEFRFQEGKGDKTVLIPIEYTTLGAGTNLNAVRISVITGGSATNNTDYTLEKPITEIFFTPESPSKQFFSLKILGDELKEEPEDVLLHVSVGQRLTNSTGAFTQTSEYVIKVIIEDFAEANSNHLTVNDYYPLRFSVGTNLNVIDKDKVGGNIYLDIMALDQVTAISNSKLVLKAFKPWLILKSFKKSGLAAGGATDVAEQVSFGTAPGATPFEDSFATALHDYQKANDYRSTFLGGYLRVSQNQGVAVVRDVTAPRVKMVTNLLPASPVFPDSTLDLQATRYQYQLKSTVVRSTGVAAGVNGLVSYINIGARSVCKISFGYCGELVKREILVSYDSSRILRETLPKVARAKYFKEKNDSRNDLRTENILVSFDGYFGINSVITYKIGTLAFTAVPAIGFVGTTINDRTPDDGFGSTMFLNMYATLSEQRYGFTLGCDIKSLPYGQQVPSFNIFVNKAFSLEKVAEALRFQ